MLHEVIHFIVNIIIEPLYADIVKYCEYGVFTLESQLQVLCGLVEWTMPVFLVLQITRLLCITDTLYF